MACTTAPAARSAFGDDVPSEAAIDENSSGEAGGNPNDVLDFVPRDAEVFCDVGYAVAGSEAIDEVLNPAPPWTTSGCPNARSGSTITSAAV